MSPAVPSALEWVKSALIAEVGDSRLPQLPKVQRSVRARQQWNTYHQNMNGRIVRTGYLKRGIEQVECIVKEG